MEQHGIHVPVDCKQIHHMHGICAKVRKKRVTRKCFVRGSLCFVYSVVSALDCSYTWEHLALDCLEKGAAAGRDVADLVGKAELVDTGY